MFIIKDLKKFTISPKLQIKKSLSALNDGGVQAILVVDDDKKKFIGIVTDGDFRRYLLKDGNFDSEISAIVNKECTTSDSLDEGKLNQIFSQKNINHIPIVNDNNHLIGLALRSKQSNKRNDNKVSVVVMAGGKGSRLAPLTNIIPKPLIPIGYSTIAEKIFDTFVNQKFNDFKLIINYKKELIKSYFNEINHQYHLKFLEETKFLGTVGGMKEFSEEFSDNFFLTNCDVVTDVDYHKFFEDHINKKSYLSVLGFKKLTTVPYGVLELNEESMVTALSEKPDQTHIIMTGIYILNKKALDFIPDNEEFGMDQLIDCLIKNNKIVSSFVIEDGWYDMGQFSEYKKLLLHLDN
jgi:dTDP-glucose pyrophosphorylase